jgi:hypothetical protein
MLEIASAYAVPAADTTLSSHWPASSSSCRQSQVQGRRSFHKHLRAEDRPACPTLLAWCAISLHQLFALFCCLVPFMQMPTKLFCNC